MFSTKNKLLTRKTVVKVVNFFISADYCEALKSTNLWKLSTFIQPELLEFLSSFCKSSWETGETHCSKFEQNMI